MDLSKKCDYALILDSNAEFIFWVKVANATEFNCKGISFLLGENFKFFSNVIRYRVDLHNRNLNGSIVESTMSHPVGLFTTKSQLASQKFSAHFQFDWLDFHWWAVWLMKEKNAPCLSTIHNIGFNLHSLSKMCAFPLESVYCVENATLYMKKEKHRGFSGSFFSCSLAVSVTCRIHCY